MSLAVLAGLFCFLASMNTTYRQEQSIRTWAEDDRPREKLITKGRSSLSDAELLAIILGSGSRKESALKLGMRILQYFGNDWNELAKADVKELQSFSGVGMAKAVSLVACLEISRRRQNRNGKKKAKVSSSFEAFELFAPHLSDLQHEEFWVLYLNRANMQ